MTLLLARDCDVVILAGGLGTRLQSVLPDCQKVLAPVGDDPFVFHLFRLLTAFGVARIILALGHRAEDAIARLPEWTHRFNIEFVASVEPAPLGTGGAIVHALPHCSQERLLVLNGDSWVGVDLDHLAARHQACQATATLTVVRVDDAGRYGSVDWKAESGRVSGFREKSPDAAGRPGWINAGVYLLQRSLLAGHPPVRAEHPLSLERDVLPSLAGQGLHACPADGAFIDIGLPETYGRSEAFFARLAPQHHPEPPPCR